MVITSVGQECKSIENRYDYRIKIEVIYRERGASMYIEKFKDNFDKDRKPKCFNCNVYEHMAKYC